MRFNQGFAFDFPMSTRMTTETNSNLHHFLSIHVKLTVPVGNRIDHIVIKRQDEAVLGNNPS